MVKALKKRSFRLHTLTLVALALLLLLQIGLITLGVYSSDLLPDLDNASFNALDGTVAARSNYLQYAMVQQWRNIEPTAEALNAWYAQYLEENKATGTELSTQEQHYVPFLLHATEELIAMMRRNSVTGAYVILWSEELPHTGSFNPPGIYLRDRDPSSLYSDQNTDLLYARAPMAVVTATGISTDSNWIPLYNMKGDHAAESAFYKPYDAALALSSQKPHTLAYWTQPYCLDYDTSEAISYSMPLVAEDGSVYGVMGVEILTDYLLRQLPTSELASGQGAYMLCVKNSDGQETPVWVSSNNYRLSLNNLQEAAFTPYKNENAVFTTIQGVDFVGFTRLLHLYNEEDIYADEQWSLYALVPQSTLFTLSRQTSWRLGTILLGVIIAALSFALVLTTMFTRPIERLEQEVRIATTKARQVELTHTGMRELDTLARSIETLNAEIAARAGKFSQILEMSSFNLGAFEMNRDTGSWFASENFFHVFGDCSPSPSSQEHFFEKLRWYEPYVMSETVVNIDSKKEAVYEIPGQKSTLWVRLSVEIHQNVTTGFAEDVTLEWREMRKLEYERNHDAMTGIFNRRAFYEHYRKLFDEAQGKLKNAALVMLDLDNLKYVNDTYGHDIGDKYICATAQALQNSGLPKALVARISGDEFLAFCYGYTDEALLQSHIQQLLHRLQGTRITLPDGGSYPVRASGGFALYPQDSTAADELVRFADFAMYKGKRSKKGMLVPFEQQVYAKEAYLLQGKEALNQLIEQQCIEYHFQPIVDCKTGIVFAYEALMRPLIPTLRSPADVLTLARQESKLGAIETLTWFCAMRSFVAWQTRGDIAKDCLVFINSISSQILSLEERERFEHEFMPWLHLIVHEHTEDEQTQANLLEQKIEKLHQWNAQIALDDFGSGYNGEQMLLTSCPNFVKVDMGIVRDIDSDSGKQQRLAALAAYAKPRGIKLIAEGVETKEECKKLHQMGIDYLQGYFIASPALYPPTPSAEYVEFLHKLN